MKALIPPNEIIMETLFVTARGHGGIYACLGKVISLKITS